MKCPKCGYVSFEYLNRCKTCGKDLNQFKADHHIFSIQPLEVSAQPSATDVMATAVPAWPSEPAAEIPPTPAVEESHDMDVIEEPRETEAVPLSLELEQEEEPAEGISLASSRPDSSVDMIQLDDLELEATDKETPAPIPEPQPPLEEEAESLPAADTLQLADMIQLDELELESSSTETPKSTPSPSSSSSTDEDIPDLKLEDLDLNLELEEPPPATKTD